MILTLLTLFSNFYCVATLTCYSCTSYSHVDACNDPINENDVPFVKCDNSTDVKSPVIKNLTYACFKAMEGLGYGLKIYKRGCFLEVYNIETDCLIYLEQNRQAFTCSLCKTDYCNLGNDLFPFSGLNIICLFYAVFLNFNKIQT